MFDIALDHELETVDGALFYRGQITIGDYTESFLAAGWLWTPERYENQWRAAVAAVLGSPGKSAFVTSFTHPDAHHNVIWPAWRMGDRVEIQNRLLLREIAGILDVDRIHEVVGEHQLRSEDGEEISNWSLPVADLAAFAS